MARYRQVAIPGYDIVLQSCVARAAALAAGRLVHVLADHAPVSRPLTLVRLPVRNLTAGLRAFVDMAVAAFGAD
ncbi:hypothetical protein [Sphingomonas sp. NPDC079357]|uniref:hypothetical protein n=1 Tax=Sphingomonas sp. NPDC079357 TaxID=3364518 RepID=UPI00384C3714